MAPSTWNTLPCVCHSWHFLFVHLSSDVSS
jgi:hypothetical protein